MKIELFEEFLENLRNYIEFESKKGKNVIIYEKKINLLKFFKNQNIKVELDKYREIILQEETSLELGGTNKKSLSLIYPLSNSNFIKNLNNGRITLIGLEKKDLTSLSIDFGMIILIGGKNLTEIEWKLLRQFNFISNSIEGFSIRTIPRKFWCRVSKKIIKNFTFEFLGNSIYYLYRQRFMDLIESMEIFFVNSYSDVIDNFIEITSKINTLIYEKWLKKIEDWKKRIDCEYDWGCEICPYQEECYEIKQVLVEREKIER
jgi:CO dehydrogenase/acetyl-CoA synthase beta subunit